jgi:hypothetical protein
MTTKTLTTLIMAGVLIGSAAAAVQVVDAPLASRPGKSATELAGPDVAPLLAILPSPERFAATSAGIEQKHVPVLRLMQ